MVRQLIIYTVFDLYVVPFAKYTEFECSGISLSIDGDYGASYPSNRRNSIF